jgi:hypothetical protein
MSLSTGKRKEDKRQSDLFVTPNGNGLVAATPVSRRLILSVLPNTDLFGGAGFESVQAAIEFALAIFSL